MPITVRKYTKEELAKVKSWPIWTKEPSTFDWSYDEPETCYILEGKATVEGGGQTAAFQSGDLVVFPAGLECVWKIEKAIKKRYKFGDCSVVAGIMMA